jgi:hypothetical protein
MSYFYALALKNSFFGIHSEYDSSRVVCGSELERQGSLLALKTMSVLIIFHS